MNTNSKILLIVIFLFIVFSLNAEKIDKKILLKSAILPGLGEISMGSKTGYVFITTELISWCSYFYFKEEADLKEKASHNYAIQYAHISAQNSYPEDYFYHLSRYDDSGFATGGYNAYIVELARSRYPDDTDAQTQFINENTYSDELAWNWDNDDRQHDYSILRKRITEYTDYAQAITGAFIANRLLSMLNSIRVNSKLKNLKAEVGFNNDLDPMFMIKYRF